MEQQTVIDNTQRANPPRTKWQEFVHKVKESKHLYVLMFPFALLFVLFTVVPVFMSLGISFTYYNLLERPTFIGFDNYIKLFLEDDVFIVSLKNTLILAIITGPVSYIMAFVFAWLINELPRHMKSFMTLVFYAPSISGNAFLMWLIIFSGDAHGYLNAMLLKYGFIESPIIWLRSEQYILPVLIIVQLWLSLGVSFLAFIAGLKNVDKTLYEAGAIDGIQNRWQELWYITLPSMKSQLLFGAVMQITTSLAIAEVSISLVGFPSVNYAGHTIVTHLMDFGSIRFDLGYASAIATVLFFIMIGANLLVRKGLRRIGE